MTPNVDILCEDFAGSNTPTPTPTQILNVSSIEDINNLTVSNSVKYRARNFIPVTPFLLEAINKAIDDSNGDATFVLLDVVKAIKEFDAAHAGDNAYTEKAKSKCKDILLWLFLVCSDSDQIKPTPVSGCNSEALAEAMKSLSNDTLSPSTNFLDIVSSHVEKSLK